METKILNVFGMSFDPCVHAIEGTLNEVEGVHHSKVNLQNNNVEIIYESDKITLKKLVETIEDQGYVVF